MPILFDWKWESGQQNCKNSEHNRNIKWQDVTDV